MYNDFYGLHKNPFNVTPDTSLLFIPPKHREALAALSYAILSSKGFAVLIGDAGTGKTTLLTRILESLSTSRVHSSVILNPILTAEEFLEMVLLDFGLTDIPKSKAQRLLMLQRLLLQNHAAKKNSVLVVDEAHQLSPVLLEEVRLLSNFEFSDQKLLQIVLSGQNELGTILNQTNLRQLKQRIAIRLTIGALESSQIEDYIRFRWTRCGGSQALPFSRDALASIASWSQGIPRLINVICDNALATAFGQGLNVVESSHILQVASDLDLAPATKAIERAPGVPAADGKGNPRLEQAMAQIQPERRATTSPPELRQGYISPIRFPLSESAAERPSLIMRWSRKLGFRLVKTPV